VQFGSFNIGGQALNPADDSDSEKYPIECEEEEAV